MSMLRIEQLRFFLQQNITGVIGDVPLALATAYLIYLPESQWWVALWLTALFLLLICRGVMGRRWLEEPCDAERCRRVQRYLLILWGVYGLLWGLGPALLITEHSQTFEFLLLTVLAMAVISNLSVAGSYLAAYLLFLYPVMGIQAIYFAVEGGSHHLVIAGIIVAFLLVVTLSARNLEKNHLKNIELRFENSDLLKQMASAKDALDHASDAIAMFSRDGILNYANAALMGMTGFRKEELIGKHWNELYSDIDQVLDFFSSDDSMIGHPWQGKLHVRRKDGDEITAMSSFSPVFDSRTGRIQRCIVIQRDCQQEEFIRQRMERLQHADSLSVMAGGIAHDFNNLLTSIMGSSSLISMVRERDEKVLEYCGRINDACQKAAGLCDQMLAYSGQTSSLSHAVHVGEMLHGMRSGLNASVHSRIDGHGKFSIELDQSLPTIEIDESQLRQIITNLVLNSAEALEQRKENGRIHITASGTVLSREMLDKMYAADDVKPGNYLEISVRDNGEGMDKRTLERVFDPFYSTRFTGRGLGLPAVMGVVLSQHGAISIESAVGKGTEVKLFFPCSDLQGDLFEKAENEFTSSIIGWTGGGTVLIVDDDSALLNIAARMVERAGFKVLCANGGREAIDLFELNADDISLVLLDWSMPEMDGEEVASRLRELNSKVKLLLSSGYSERMVKKSVNMDLYAGFIHKPYSFEQLKQQIREVIGV